MSKEISVRRALIASAFLAAALVVVPSAPSAALDAEPITVQPGQSLTVQYGPIPGQDPATPQVNAGVDPMFCQLLPSCNLVPLEFVAPPTFSPEDDTYLAELTLTWDTIPVGDRNAGAASNDLDLYVWAAAWAETEPGEPCHVPDPAPEGFEAPEYCTHMLTKSAGALPPERVRFDATTHTKYLLAINNATGVNTGYTIDIASRYEPFEEPSGVPDEQFVPPVTNDDTASSTPTSSGGTTSVDELTPAGGLGGGELSLEPLPGGPDGELATLEGAGLPGANFLRRPEEAAGPPKPVSGATVAIWLAALPLVVGAAAVYWFVRKRPSALRVTFPTAKPA
jgi:hypothetical protein